VNTRPNVRKINSSSQANFDEKLRILRKSKNLDRGLTYFFLLIRYINSWYFSRQFLFIETCLLPDAQNLTELYNGDF